MISTSIPLNEKKYDTNPTNSCPQLDDDVCSEIVSFMYSHELLNMCLVDKRISGVTVSELTKRKPILQKMIKIFKDQTEDVLSNVKIEKKKLIHGVISIDDMITVKLLLEREADLFSSKVEDQLIPLYSGYDLISSKKLKLNAYPHFVIQEVIDVVEKGKEIQNQIEIEFNEQEKQRKPQSLIQRIFGGFNSIQDTLIVTKLFNKIAINRRVNYNSMQDFKRYGVVKYVIIKKPDLKDKQTFEMKKKVAFVINDSSAFLNHCLDCARNSDLKQKKQQ